MGGIDYKLDARYINEGNEIIVFIKPANPADILKIKTILSTSDLEIYGFKQDIDELADGNPLYDACSEKAVKQAKENAERISKASGMKLGRIDKVSHYYDSSSNSVMADVKFEMQ